MGIGRKINRLFIFVFILVNISLLAENNYILWKVTKGESTVYLAPTVHCLPDNFYPLNSKVDNIFESSDYLVVELDPLDDKTIKIIQNDGIKYMRNKENKTLKELLDSDDYRKLKVEFQKLGLNLDALGTLNPGALTQLVLQILLSREGYNFNSGLDNYYLLKAKKMGKPILELEGVLFQLERVFSLEFNLQLEGLKEIFTEDGKRNNLMGINAFVDYVKLGDLENLEKNFKDAVTRGKSLEAYYKVIFDERNTLMEIKIEEYLENKGTYFVAIGAGHYLGENNIRELLEKKVIK